MWCSNTVMNEEDISQRYTSWSETLSPKAEIKQEEKTCMHDREVRVVGGEQD